MLEETDEALEVADLEDGEVHATPRNDVGHGLGDIVACVLPQQIPQSVLEREAMTVALGAQVIKDQSVIWIVGLFEVAAV